MIGDVLMIARRPLHDRCLLVIPPKIIVELNDRSVFERNPRNIRIPGRTNLPDGDYRAAATQEQGKERCDYSKSQLLPSKS